MVGRWLVGGRSVGGRLVVGRWWVGGRWTGRHWLVVGVIVKYSHLIIFLLLLFCLMLGPS